MLWSLWEQSCEVRKERTERLRSARINEGSQRNLRYPYLWLYPSKGCYLPPIPNTSSELWHPRSSPKLTFKDTLIWPYSSPFNIHINGNTILLLDRLVGSLSQKPIHRLVSVVTLSVYSHSIPFFVGSGPLSFLAISTIAPSASELKHEKATVPKSWGRLLVAFRALPSWSIYAGRNYLWPIIWIPSFHDLRIKLMTLTWYPTTPSCP